MAEKANLFLYDAPLIEKSGGLLAGVDEAGRGPLAGPVCTAAVILPPHPELCGLNDSKKLSEKRREALYEQIIQQAIAYQIVMVGPETIDQINILQATYEAMRKAVAELSVQPSLLLVDAVHIPGLDIPQVGIIKGDAKSQSIAAASVIAKVTRDRLMEAYDPLFPEYHFASNKGYGTAAHIEALKKNGACTLHRRTFIGKFLGGERQETSGLSTDKKMAETEELAKTADRADTAGGEEH